MTFIVLFAAGIGLFLLLVSPHLRNRSVPIGLHLEEAASTPAENRAPGLPLKHTQQ